MDYLFEIENLVCQYVAGKTVLTIPTLKIPRGKLIFLIGPSGIGKSTMIETLGLMNNTIKQTKEVSIQFNLESTSSIQLETIWQKERNTIADFRKKYFSFIFQNTNLMPNFTAGENMIISALLNGYSINDAKQQVLLAMDQLALERKIYDRKITEVSGGQRQRIAFVRAIVGGFDVLFGDEPTGNLDRHNAYELMKVLKQLLITQNKTGIVVSHDLPLALEYADMIIPITFTKTSTKADVAGEILNSKILYKNNQIWETESKISTNTILEYLEMLLYKKQVSL